MRESWSKVCNCANVEVVEYSKGVETDFVTGRTAQDDFCHPGEREWHDLTWTSFDTLEYFA